MPSETSEEPGREKTPEEISDDRDRLGARLREAKKTIAQQAATIERMSGLLGKTLTVASSLKGYIEGVAENLPQVRSSFPEYDEVRSQVLAALAALAAQGETGA